MEDRNLELDGFRLRLSTRLEVGDSSPVLRIKFYGGSSTNTFFRQSWDDESRWRRYVERMIQTAIHHGEFSRSFDIPLLVDIFCHYFYLVVFELPMGYGGTISIDVEINVVDAATSPALSVDDVPKSEDMPLLVNFVKVITFGVEVEKTCTFNDQCCSICLEDFKAGQQFEVMPCHHGFHMECLEKWFVRSYACPLCRFDLFSE